MYCSQCGKEIPNNSKFCNECGSPTAQVDPPFDFEAFDAAYKEKNQEATEESSAMEKVTSAAKAFLKNKKAVKRAVIVVAVLVLAIIVTCTIHNSRMAKITLEQIEEHIENEEYEFAFDKINSGYISDEDVEKYREIVVPYMQEEFTDAKKSERDTLSLIVDGTEYFFYDGESLANSYDKIYTYIYTKENDKRTILYEVPDGDWDISGSSYMSADYYLDPELCMYANNCLFFIEEKSIGSLTSRSEYYALKCLDLSTGISKEIGSDEYFKGMYKLEDGSIFVKFGYRNPGDGIRYNPYTESSREGKNVATEEEIENAIYKAN